MHISSDEKYIEIMRKKSGEERVKIAFELNKLALKSAEAGIKSANPNISSEELHKQLQERIYGTKFSFEKNRK